MLFQGFRPALDLLLRKVFFDPTVLIKNLMNVLSLIDLIQAEGLRRSWQMPDRLAELSRMIQSGRAGNITEAIRVYEEGEK